MAMGHDLGSALFSNQNENDNHGGKSCGPRLAEYMIDKMFKQWDFGRTKIQETACLTNSRAVCGAIDRMAKPP